MFCVHCFYVVLCVLILRGVCVSYPRDPWVPVWRGVYLLLRFMYACLTLLLCVPFPRGVYIPFSHGILCAFFYVVCTYVLNVVCACTFFHVAFYVPTSRDVRVCAVCIFPRAVPVARSSRDLLDHAGCAIQVRLGGQLEVGRGLFGMTQIEGGEWAGLQQLVDAGGRVRGN